MEEEKHKPKSQGVDAGFIETAEAFMDDIVRNVTITSINPESLVTKT